MKKTLYVLSCHKGRIGLLFTLYAETRKEANTQAAEIMRDNECEFNSLKPYPGGFKIVFASLAGEVEVENSAE
jgi:hypothetical protein